MSIKEITQKAITEDNIDRAYLVSEQLWTKMMNTSQLRFSLNRRLASPSKYLHDQHAPFCPISTLRATSSSQASIGSLYITDEQRSFQIFL